MLGNPGQAHSRRPPPEPDPEADEGQRAPICLPSACVRVMNTFRMECPATECPGLQRDGTCLGAIVKEAAGRGMRTVLELDREGYWMPTGETPL